MRHHEWLSDSMYPQRRLYSKQWERGILKTPLQKTFQSLTTSESYTLARLSPLKISQILCFLKLPYHPNCKWFHNKQNHILLHSLTTPTAVGFFLNLKLLLKGKFSHFRFSHKKTGKEKKSFFTCKQCNFSYIF